jgi:hypothetical protein
MKLLVQTNPFSHPRCYGTDDEEAADARYEGQSIGRIYHLQGAWA